MISIIVPTIAGRETELERCVAAYSALTPVEHEIIAIRDLPTCAHAWNDGAALANGDHLHMTADDLEPTSAEWAQAALDVVARGNVPVGWVIEEQSTFGRDFARIPFCQRDWWRDVPLVHYYSDNAFTDLMAAEGHAVEVAPGYDFLHGRSPVGRDESPERLARDEAAYRAALG